MPDIKFKKTIRGLDGVQAVYGLIIALGFRDVFLGAYAFFAKGNPPRGEWWVSFLLFVNVILLGIRFFWVPRNLRTTIATYAKVQALKPDPSASSPIGKMRGWLIAFSVVAIFVHAAVFYALCSEFEFFIFTLGVRSPFQASVFEGYVLLHVLLLIINAAWITMLTRHEDRISRNVLPPEYHDGVTWARNNLAFSVGALGPLALLGPCKSGAEQCLATLDGRSQLTFTMLPTSPLATSELAELLTRLFPRPDLTLSIIVLTLLLLNSVVDLVSTGRHYIVLEEIEMEQVPGPK